MVVVVSTKQTRYCGKIHYVEQALVDHHEWPLKYTPLSHGIKIHFHLTTFHTLLLFQIPLPQESTVNYIFYMYTMTVHKTDTLVLLNVRAVSLAASYSWRRIKCYNYISNIVSVK